MPPLYFHVTYRQNDVVYHVEFSTFSVCLIVYSHGDMWFVHPFSCELTARWREQCCLTELSAGMTMAYICAVRGQPLATLTMWRVWLRNGKGPLEQHDLLRGEPGLRFCSLEGECNSEVVSRILWLWGYVVNGKNTNTLRWVEQEETDHGSLKTGPRSSAGLTSGLLSREKSKVLRAFVIYSHT